MIAWVVIYRRQCRQSPSPCSIQMRVRTSWKGTPPGILHEYQNKGFVKFAFRKWLNRKGMDYGKQGQMTEAIVHPEWFASRSDLRTFPKCSELSALLSRSSALFCTFLHSQKTQLFSFQSLPHSASKNTRAGEGGPTLLCRPTDHGPRITCHGSRLVVSCG